MPDWLAEPETVLILLVAIAAIGSGVIAWRTRHRAWVIIAFVSLLFLGLLFLLDKMFLSDREQIAGSVQSMAAAVAPKDFNQVFSHISERFEYGPVNKAAFRKFAEDTSRNRQIDSLVVWNFQVLKFNETKDQAEVSFQFKVKAGGRLGNIEEVFYLCKAVYLKEADGQWRMKTFKVYPLSSGDQQLTIPGLG
jgi:ketosteroid isomerase-like protein